MRDSLKSIRGWLWALAFLALPNCTFQVQGLAPYNFDRGDAPYSSAVFCDIQDRTASAPHCATADEISMGIPLSQSALALTQNRKSNIGLDYSPMVTMAHGCAAGVPVAITYKCPFPDGCGSCFNCGGVIPAKYADVGAACIADCLDKNGHTPGENPPQPDVTAFCTAEHAHASYAAGTCFANACIPEGALDNFADPRRVPEPVVWQNLVGVVTDGPAANSLTRTLALGPDAGASSVQTIDHGDGYVEFTITELGTIRVLGLSTGAADADASINDIGFGVRLSAQNNLGIFENGTRVPDGANADWGPFQAGDRVRVNVKDRFDGTADITNTLIPAACAGAACTGTTFGPSIPHTGSYPFRVDAFIRDPQATLTDVRIVRIK